MTKASNYPIRLPQGVSDFKELIQGNYTFVDKTLFIREVIEDGAKVIVITRPRRFGKTLNLSMLYHFLKAGAGQGSGLFEGLEIAQDISFCEEHQNKYPVIFVSFKDIKLPNYEAAYADIVKLIQSLYAQHRYLLEGSFLPNDQKQTFIALLEKRADESDVKAAIKQLSEYITKKFDKPPIILFDEYDTPIQEAYLRGYYDEMISLMRSILGAALKDNSEMTKAVVTGITRISQESLFSGVNNLDVYSLLQEEYGQYFGFTEAEVIRLIAATGHSVSLDSIREWYNGYQVGKYELYNPWSIINCLKKHGALKAYWLNTGSTELINRLLRKSSPNVKDQFEELLQGKIIEQAISENLVFPTIETRAESLWSFLLYVGYLKVLSSELHGRRLMAKLAIPNKEVSFVYDEIIEQWFSDSLGLPSYDEFVRALRDGDLEKFKQYLSSYIMQTGSYFDFNKHTPEFIFHMFVLGMIVGLRSYYYIYSNRESGLGRFDVILIPNDKQRQGIVLEFKTSQNLESLKDKAQESLSQIKDKHYVEVFKQNEISSMLAIGLAFFGKQLELAHETIILANNANPGK